MSESQTDFVKTYGALRQREGWTCSDEVLRTLPQVAPGSEHSAEWALRARSAERFRDWLSAATPCRLLEVGCGNGWLSHFLARVNGIDVTGIDINGPELQQAQRTFQRPNLRFIESTLEALNATRYHHILFAASFQYFANAHAVLEAAFQRLEPGGSVHIIDTHFYKTGERVAAAQRSAHYFEKQQAAAMRRFYFHHCLSDIHPYKYEVRNRWSWRLHRLTGNLFPWIQIKKPA
jgi:2-polyprenyl-3-methyl-5-hydroxy-6-metoxy-1,4-benzoquinol methylase